MGIIAHSSVRYYGKYNIAFFRGPVADEAKGLQRLANGPAGLELLIRVNIENCPNPFRRHPRLVAEVFGKRRVIRVFESSRGPHVRRRLPQVLLQGNRLVVGLIVSGLGPKLRDVAPRIP
jgi:hypothetical protein